MLCITNIAHMHQSFNNFLPGNVMNKQNGLENPLEIVLIRPSRGLSTSRTKWKRNMVLSYGTIMELVSFLLFSPYNYLHGEK